MSLDSEASASAISGRDWFFPSPSFFRSSSSQTQYSRRFYSNSKPYSPPNSNRLQGIRYRRIVKFPRTRSRTPTPTPTPTVTEEKEKPLLSDTKDKPSAKNNFFCFSQFRCQFAFVTLTIAFLLLLLLRNTHLESQVNKLQGEILSLNLRLHACHKLDSLNITGATVQDPDPCSSENLKRNVALVFSFTLLFIPLIIFKYIDYVSKSRFSDNISEQVSLNKQIAYRVDVFLSVHPYAKPLVLLVATLLLIFLGGLALFGVTSEDLAHCLWLSWTYVADSGNHASSEGFGPRLVAISISFGGMLIFAMMLGLVSDAISEKFDSLRKGKSEVVEQNHTLILGWSDKLGSLLNQLAIANESLGGGTVVVMAERDKEEMELDIAKMEFDFKGTSVICRSGSPLILADLKKIAILEEYLMKSLIPLHNLSTNLSYTKSHFENHGNHFGEKAKGLDTLGFKLCYISKVKSRNGVGMIVDKNWKNSVMDVRRLRDRILAPEFVVEHDAFNIISVYAPQVG